MTTLVTGDERRAEDWVRPTAEGGLDSRLLRDAFGCIPSGVIAVCALADDGTPAGMAVSSFATVSLSPPLVSVCIQSTSGTWPMLQGRQRLGISVLAEEQHREGRQLASRDGDRFAGLQWQAAEDGAVYLGDAVAWFNCSITDQVPAGDHLIALLEIHAVRTSPHSAPLVFHGSRFRSLAPGKPTTT